MQSSGATTQAGPAVATIPMLIDGAWRTARDLYEVRDPYRATITAHAPQSSMSDLDDALASATKGRRVAAAMPGYERSALAIRDMTEERLVLFNL